jgi:hypothetical protein
MSLFKVEKSLDSLIYENTANEIISNLIESYKNENVENTTYSKINGIENSVFDVNFSDNISNLYKIYHNYGNNKNLIHYNSISKSIEISKVGNFNISINDSLKILKELIMEDESIYGITLIKEDNNSNKKIFNPLCPLIAYELKHNNYDMNEKIYTLVIYSLNYENINNYDKLNFYNNYNEELISLVSIITTNRKINILNSNFNAYINEDNEYELEFDYIISDKNGVELLEETDKDYIVPVQLLNLNGVIYPYYGAVYSKNGFAWNLTPMLSANIHIPHELDKSGICTNSGDSTTKKGISALNHCNTTSPLNPTCLMPTSLSYAKQAMIFSLEFLLEEKIINKKELSLVEFLKENPNKTKLDFIKYLQGKK